MWDAGQQLVPRWDGLYLSTLHLTLGASDFTTALNGVERATSKLITSWKTAVIYKVVKRFPWPTYEVLFSCHGHDQGGYSLVPSRGNGLLWLVLFTRGHPVLVKVSCDVCKNNQIRRLIKLANKIFFLKIKIFFWNIKN